MRKKLFAVIMSVMMMVTFMPTMAFAYGMYDPSYVKFNSDFSKATYKDGGFSMTVDTVRTLVADSDGQTWTGQIKATAYFDFNDDGDVTDTGEFETSNYYYDLASSQLYGIGTETGLDKYDGLDYDYVFGKYYQGGSLINGFFNTNEKSLPAVVKFTVPSYITAQVNNGDLTANQAYDNMTKGKKSTQLSTYVADKFSGSEDSLEDFAELTVDVPKNDPEKQYTDQVLSIKVFADPEDYNYENSVYGEVPTRSFEVYADEANYMDAEYIVDGKEDNLAYYTQYYDGAEHEVTQIELPGVTTAFEVWNKETNKYEAVDKVTFKNVGEYKVKIIVTDKAGKHPAEYFTIDVEASSRINFAFVDNDVWNINNGLPTSNGFDGFYVGSNFNPKDFIVAVPGQYAHVEPAKKALEADKTEIMALFDELCEITKTDNQYQEGIVDAKMTFKELTTAERKAIEEKYETLLANYEVNGYSWNESVDTTRFQVKDEVTFTKAPLNKTYKAKNGKLAKAKKFTVKAKSLSGAKVTYKLANGGSRIVINKNTGKVTLKKGLKKRTYNVKITATAGSYIGTTESVVVRIKVK